MCSFVKIKFIVFEIEHHFEVNFTKIFLAHAQIGNRKGWFEEVSYFF